MDAIDGLNMKVQVLSQVIRELIRGAPKRFVLKLWREGLGKSAVNDGILG